VAARGEAADEDVRIERVALHADAIAEDGAARERRGRIDAHDTDALAGGTIVRDQRVDDGGLAGAGVAGDADDVRVAGLREQRLQLGERGGDAIVEIAHEARGGANVEGEGHGGGFLKRCSGPAGV
jgi:hypothetical protein